MTKFWTFFLDKHHFTILIAVVLSAAGVYAALAIPKESSPEVQIPVGIVTTILPGASAEDVERLVTDKMEDRVLGIERVSKVTSSSGDGVSAITVEFEASADIKTSIDLLKEEVDKARPELPSEAEDPLVSDVNFADQPIILASVSGNLAPAELTALGEALQDELERVPGVSSVGLSGVRSREVSVVIEQAKLEQYGLAVSDVTNAIRMSGLASPIGSIVVENVRYAVRLEAGITATEEVAAIALPSAGVPLYLRDVARIIDGLEDPATFSRVSVEGAPSAPALAFSIFKSRGGNIVETGNAVKEKLGELEDSLLSGTEVVISYDAADDVEHDLVELTRVGIETVALVMIMLLLTLGWRESLAAAASIPLSFLIAFIGLYASGNTINFVSLFSLILAIGILVDTGIVVVEAIHTRLIAYGDKRRAAISTIKEYAWPLTAGTLTTVAVFVPLFFLSGIMGKFVASIPFTVIFVLLASIFVALGLIPLLSLYLIRPTLSSFEKRQERYNERAKEWYERILRNLLADRKAQNRFLWGMGFLFVVALALPATGAVQSVFFPNEDMDFIYVEVEKPHGTALAGTDLSVREVEEILYGDPRIESFVSEVGVGSSFAATPSSGSKIANITVNLREERTETSAQVMRSLRTNLSSITSARITVSEAASGPPSGAPFVATFSGEDLGALASSVDRAAQVLSDIEGVVNVTTSTRDNGPEFVIDLDPSKAAAQGVSAALVAETLRTALFGVTATSIRSGDSDIDVTVKLDLNPAYRDPSETAHVTIDAVRRLLIRGQNGSVPLSSVAVIRYESAESAIRHEDGRRVATLTSEVTTNPLTASAEFERRMNEEQLPQGISMKIGGETEDVNRSFAEMGIALLAGAALMLAILVLEFNSFRHSLYLLLVIPLSLIGVMGGLLLTGQPLSFSSMLGVIALSGVIINHAIILMDSIARIGKEHQGNLTDIVVEASSSRFRPIVLTTATTVVGMIPLSFASALWGPLAFAIMFGLAFSMVLTLVLIPILYHRWPGKAVRAQYASREASPIRN